MSVIMDHLIFVNRDANNIICCLIIWHISKPSICDSLWVPGITLSVFMQSYPKAQILKYTRWYLLYTGMICEEFGFGSHCTTIIYRYYRYGIHLHSYWNTSRCTSATAYWGQVSGIFPLFHWEPATHAGCSGARCHLQGRTCSQSKPGIW